MLVWGPGSAREAETLWGGGERAPGCDSTTAQDRTGQVPRQGLRGQRGQRTRDGRGPSGERGDQEEACQGPRRMRGRDQAFPTQKWLLTVPALGPLSPCCSPGHLQAPLQAPRKGLLSWWLGGAALCVDRVPAPQVWSRALTRSYGRLLFFSIFPEPSPSPASLSC